MASAADAKLLSERISHMLQRLRDTNQLDEWMSHARELVRVPPRFTHQRLKILVHLALALEKSPEAEACRQEAEDTWTEVNQTWPRGTPAGLALELKSLRYTLDSLAARVLQDQSEEFIKKEIKAHHDFFSSRFDDFCAQMYLREQNEWQKRIAELLKLAEVGMNTEEHVCKESVGSVTEEVVGRMEV